MILDFFTQGFFATVGLYALLSLLVSLWRLAGRLMRF